MSRSLIQVINPFTQTVSENSIISLGSVQRRFGCNLRMSGNAIEAEGAGYYTVDATVTVEPTAAGTVTVAVYENGSPLPGAVASSYVATAGNPVTVPIVGTFRVGCACTGADALTLVLLAGAGDVTNVSMRVVKE